MAAGQFYPYLQTGLSTVADAARRATVTLVLNEDGQNRDLTVPLSLAGPGDMIGVAPEAIRRVMPQPGTSDHRAGALPYIEFNDPAFPWLMSPAVPNGDKLIPYLALLCLPDGDTTTIDHGAQPLPVIEARDLSLHKPDDTEPSATFLPAPEDCVLAAHVHDPEGQAGDTTPGDAAFARLLGLQRLVAGRAYHAVLVPLFASGREAGLGEDASGVSGFAWDAADDTVRLPVYYRWKFRAGPARGVEDLLRDLAAHDASKDSALPPDLALENAFGGAAGAFSRQSVAVRTIFNPNEPPDPVHEDALVAALAEGQAGGVLPHPSYGRVHAEADAGRSGPTWYREANLDPSLRLLAGSGAAIVRDRQDEIVRFVRDAAGPFDEVNAVLSRAHTAMRANSGANRAIAAASDPQALFQLAGPAQARMRVQIGQGATLSEILAGTREEQASDPAVRALAGKAAAGMAQAIGTETCAVELADEVAGAGLEEAGLNALLDTADGPGPLADEEARRDIIGLLGELVDPPSTPSRRRDGEDAGLGQWSRETGQERFRPGRRRCVPALQDPDQVAAEIKHQLDPEVSVPPRIRSRIGGLDDGSGALPPRAVIEPVWPRPFVSEMLRTAPEFLTPGLTSLPPDSIAGMRYDAAAMEAIMLGANHEVQRELRWRGIPAASHLSPVRRAFARFEAAGLREHDIMPISDWPDDALGRHQAIGGLDFVAVMRSPLIRRFPETVIAMVKAIRPDPAKPRELDPNSDPVLPAVIGTLSGDLAYVGFPKVAGALRGDPASRDEGWFLVFSQTSDDIQFGLNAPASDPPRDPASLESWSELSWSDVGTATISGSRFAANARSDIAWGVQSAQMAAILFERPTIVALHLSDLLPALL